MPSSRWSPSGILTIISLVALCIISFIVVLGSDNIVDTNPVRDIVYSFPRRNLYTPRHRRALQHHGRAPTPFPQAAVPAVSATGQGTVTNAGATPSQSDTPAKSPTSPSPSPSPTSDSQHQTPASSSPPSSESHAPAASATSTSPSASLTSAVAPTSTPASTSQSASSPNVPTSSNTAINSVTNNVSNQQPSITFLDSSTPDSAFPNPTAAKSVVSAEPTAGATAKGFFANKGAVGVVFGMLGLAFALAVIVAGRMVLNRYRSAREEREVDEFFEKYSSGGHTIDDDHHHGANAPDVFANTGAMTHAAPDAYPDRSIHYGGSGSAPGFPPSVDFGIPYPPSAAGASIQHSVPSEHPFAAEANASNPAGAPPVTYHYSPYYNQAQATGSDDSFYGYEATGGGPVNMGYAQ